MGRGKSGDGTNVYVLADGIHHRICKVWFGNDGSYYATVPKFAEKSGVLSLNKVNYDTGFNEHRFIAFDDQPVVASLDHGSVKLSHHLSGMCQFSGPGITSGRDTDGEFKGVAVDSWPLPQVGDGPAFGVSTASLEGFDTKSKPRDCDVIFDADSIANHPIQNGFCLEGFYRQPDFLRFLRKSDEGRWELQTMHPSGACMKMPVTLAPTEAEYPGLIAFHLYRQKCNLPAPGYSLGGPGGNMSRNALNEKTGETLSYLCPKLPEMQFTKTADYLAEQDEERLIGLDAETSDQTSDA